MAGGVYVREVEFKEKVVLVLPRLSLMAFFGGGGGGVCS